MTEQVQEQPATENTQSQDTTQEQRTLTWEEHQAELKRVGSKEKKQGKSAAETALLEKSGAGSIDELITAYTSAQEVARELEGEQVQAVRSEYEEKVKGANERAERYEEALKTYLETQRDGVPEHITTLLDSMDVVDQLNYLSKNREALVDPKPSTVGRGSAPGGSASARLDFTNMSQAEFEQVQAQVRAGNVIRP
jgi:hypothetical protein